METYCTPRGYDLASVQRAIWAKTWLENEQDMTGISNVGDGSLTKRRVASAAAEVDETALGEEDDVAAGSHGEAVNLGLDVDVLDGVLLEPGNVDLDVKVADAGCQRSLGPKR